MLLSVAGLVHLQAGGAFSLPTQLKIRVKETEVSAGETVLVNIAHYVRPPQAPVQGPRYALEVLNDAIPPELEECYLEVTVDRLQANSSNPAEYGHAMCR